MHHTQFCLKAYVGYYIVFACENDDISGQPLILIHTYQLVPLIDKFWFTFCYCFCLQGNEITLFHSEFDRSFAGVKQDVSISLTEVGSLCIHLCIT